MQPVQVVSICYEPSMPAGQPMRILILADDLSGAADCGAACVEAGLDTLVLLDTDEAAGDAQVLAADLDSRGLGAAEARAVTRLAADRLLTPGDLLFKKIDSTLRGNPGPEIAAAREAMDAVTPRYGAVLALVAPAFPGTGRITRNGRVLVHGVPLEHTETWRREGKGVDPDLAVMLRTAGIKTGNVPLKVIRGGELEATLRQAVADENGAVVCDAETDGDLARIAAAGAALGPAVVWAGSAGLARHMAALTATSLSGQRGRSSFAATRRQGPIVAVVGSMSAVGRAQVSALAGLAGSLAITVTPEVLSAPHASPRWAATEQRLGQALETTRDGGLLIVSIGAEPEERAPGRLLCAALAGLLAQSVGCIGALVAAGGETARAVLTHAGGTGLRLVGEIEPGVPLGMAMGVPGAPLPVVTKAGAFGDEGTLVRCVRAMRALPLGFAAGPQDYGREAGTDG